MLAPNIIIPILFEIFFLIACGLIYMVCVCKSRILGEDSENVWYGSVTKMQMFVCYINASTWVWGIFSFFYLFVFEGPIDAPLGITALVLLSVFFLSSCFEMCCSREGRYFRHQKTMKECIEHMNDVKKAAPIHRIDVVCYHNETTSVPYTDKDGKEQTRTETRKVITHQEGRNFAYDTWTDKSDYPNLPEISKEWPIVAVQSKCTVDPGDDYTRQKFDNFKSNFLAEMRLRDDEIEETITTRVPGHKSQITAKSETRGEVPWWLSKEIFYCLALVFCSCPLRVIFKSKAKKHKFKVNKLYFVAPSASPNTDIENEDVTSDDVNETLNKPASARTYLPPPAHNPNMPSHDQNIPAIDVVDETLNIPASAPLLPPPAYNPNMASHDPNIPVSNSNVLPYSPNMLGQNLNVLANIPNMPPHNPNMLGQNLNVLANIPNMPPHSPNMPPHSPNIPAHNPNMPPHSPNMPPHSPNMPPHSPNILVQNLDVPPYNQSMPHSPNMPPHSPNITAYNPNVPPQSQNMTVYYQSIPVYNPSEPVFNPNLPAHNPHMPSNSPNMTVHNLSVPAQNPIVPTHNPSLPVHNPNVPVWNPSMPVHNSNVLPYPIAEHTPYETIINPASSPLLASPPYNPNIY